MSTGTGVKQLLLKPQDLVVALKVAVNGSRSLLLSELAQELSLAIATVHGAILRAERARLITRSTGHLRISSEALREFVLHGVKYCFPGELGTLNRGMPTAIGGPSLSSSFEAGDTLVPVWPDPNGTSYGPSLAPLYPSVPAAASRDAMLYDVLSLIDALRVGAARERELAASKLAALL